jgi:hypothetical protein
VPGISYPERHADTRSSPDATRGVIPWSWFPELGAPPGRLQRSGERADGGCGGEAAVEGAFDLGAGEGVAGEHERASGAVQHGSGQIAVGVAKRHFFTCASRTWASPIHGAARASSSTRRSSVDRSQFAALHGTVALHVIAGIGLTPRIR